MSFEAAGEGSLSVLRKLIPSAFVEPTLGVIALALGSKHSENPGIVGGAPQRRPGYRPGFRAAPAGDGRPPL
jgi:hypothetical protein